MPSRINQLLLKQYKNALAGVTSIVAIGYPKMGVIKTHALRGLLAAQGFNLLFVKNRIANIALKEMGVEGALKMMSGQTAFAFGGEDPVALARLVQGFQKEHPEVVIHGALVDGTVVDAKGAAELAKSPSKPELQARIAGQILAPARNIASAILAPANQIASQIKTDRKSVV